MKSFKAGNNGGNKNTSNLPEQVPLEAGTYPARLAWLILVGMQEQRPFAGQQKDPAPEIILGYEFLDEFCTDKDGKLDEEQPRLLSEKIPFFSLGSERARSTRRYMSLDPNLTFDGDWSQLIGMPLNVTITTNPSKKNGKVYNNVAEVSKMRSKDEDVWKDKGVLDTRLFSIYEPDIEAYRILPKWVQDVISKALDYNESPLAKLLGEAAPAEATQAAPQEETADEW